MTPDLLFTNPAPFSCPPQDVEGHSTFNLLNFLRWIFSFPRKSSHPNAFFEVRMEKGGWELIKWPKTKK